MALARAGFTLGVKPVSALRPHEETIPSHVRGIAAEMKKDLQDAEKYLAGDSGGKAEIAP